MELKIPNNEIQELLSGQTFTYPKYATQLMNLANQNAQGTRPKIVGQMSELIQQFPGNTLAEWEQWYLERHPNAIDTATDRVFPMIEAFRQSIQHIDRETVRSWIQELVIVKTFAGLKFQLAILEKVAAQLDTTCRLALPEEESTGIDGYIGETAVSIKPQTYKVMMGLNEVINVPIIFYDKRKNDIIIEFNEQDFSGGNP